MLKQRVITAVILASVFVLALFALPAAAFLALLGVVFLVAAWEWGRLSGLSTTAAPMVYAAFLLALLLLVFQGQRLGFIPITAIWALGALWWCVALLLVATYPNSAAVWARPLFRLLMGGLVLLPAALAVIYLRLQEGGQWLIVLLLTLVAAADSGAYFSGRAWGKRKLAPAVSPGKSWEGVGGGIVAVVLLALGLTALRSGSDLGVLLAILVPAAMVSVLGDLLESMVKRQAGVKDSGRLLPGHGGFLDRIDGLTAAAPVFALTMVISGWSW